jgi:ABC-type phosphate transport system substrate-binding protein
MLASSSAANAAGSHALIQGSGSSWSSNAVNQWIADVQSNGLQVVFTASGSAQGRKDFGYATTDFAVTDIGYQGKDRLTGDTDTPCNGTKCRAYAYLPIVAGGTSFPYHITVAGQLVRNLRLSGLTLAKIFTNQISNWNDPAITADNNGRKLPSLPIIPVVHSEGSGSTAQFTSYLDKRYTSVWRGFSGASGLTEYYPRKGSAIAQNGSDGVINYITSGSANGTIGYDEYSYALAKNYPVVKLENAAGYYTLPTQYNVAVALQKAKINTNKSDPNYLLQDLSNVYTYTDPRTYAMSSYSYMVIPTAPDDPRMTTAKRQTLVDYLYYSVCQGQAEMGPIGYSPLPLNLVQASFDQTSKLKTADPKVDITKRDVTTCRNPTFVAGNLSANHLAQIAPVPPTCDKSGQGPCTDGGNNGTSGPPSSSGSSGSGGGSTSGGSTGTGGAGTGASGNGANAGAGAAAGGHTKAPTKSTSPAAGSVNPDTGATTAGSGGQGVDVTGVPTDLVAYRQTNMTKILAPLAVLELLALLLLPPVIYLYVLRRRRVQ